MIRMYKDVICRVVGKGQGSPIISARIVNRFGSVPQARSFLRRLFGGGSGGGATHQTVNNTSAPWDAQQPHLQDIFARSQQQSNQPRSFYPGRTTPPFSPETKMGLGLAAERARKGSPVQKSANEELMKTLRGDYLYGGPGFDAAFQAASNKILPGVHSRFASGGRYGSGLARQAETSALADAFASQYQNERMNQLRGMLFAPEAAAADYKDFDALTEVGGRREDLAQQKIDEKMARHNFAQQEPGARLADYLGNVQGNYGYNNSQFEPFQRPNRAKGFFAGAGTGARIGAGAGPWGAGIGGLLGGLMGGFL